MKYNNNLITRLTFSAIGWQESQFAKRSLNINRKMHNSVQIGCHILEEISVPICVIILA